MGFLRSLKPSPSMVVAATALLVALTGTSVAAVSVIVPRSSVGTAQLKNNAVVSSKVQNNSLLRADFRAGQIPAGPAGPEDLQEPRVQRVQLDQPDLRSRSQVGARQARWRNRRTIRRHHADSEADLRSIHP